MLRKLSIRNQVNLIAIGFALIVIINYLVGARSNNLNDEIVLVLSLIIIGVIYYVVITNLVRLFYQVMDVVIRISKGDLSKKVSYQNGSELGALAKALNSINDYIANATELIKSIEEGDLEGSTVKNVEVNDDPLSQALIGMRNRMSEINREEQERIWITNGLATFSEKLRQESEGLKKLCRETITSLVKYMDANQGGFFLVEETSEGKIHLELVAAYAYGREKFLNRTIHQGEGLVGQVFLEKKYIYLTEVPENYIEITSGLGEATPRSVLIIPIIANAEVYGVIEMASFKTFAPYQIEFTQRLGESIASTVFSVRNVSKTRKLLEETQQQAEQMRAQEEEMRQNVEELAATQEEMARKQRELEKNNQRMSNNESVLKKALMRAKEVSKEIENKNRHIELQEKELRDSLEHLQLAKLEMEKKNDEIGKANSLLQANELELKQAISDYQKEKEESEKHRIALEKQSKENTVYLHKLKSNEVLLKKATQRMKKQQEDSKMKFQELEEKYEEVQKQLDLLYSDKYILIRDF